MATSRFITLAFLITFIIFKHRCSRRVSSPVAEYSSSVPLRSSFNDSKSLKRRCNLSDIFVYHKASKSLRPVRTTFCTLAPLRPFLWLRN
ncbi:hypothetical protein Q3G72_024801 [Acer saccharum]|nr:hypothetical protein Q3G72_024801 [Acer saccharum]